MPLYQNNANAGLGYDVSRSGAHAASPAPKLTVTGSRADPEAALKNLLAQLAALGIITDSTTA